jgi:hypothetical protein
MKLSDWARSRGIKYKTTWLWWRDGTLPVAAEQMATGTILVSEGEAPKGTAGLYAGVSSSDQRNDWRAAWAVSDIRGSARMSSRSGGGRDWFRVKRASPEADEAFKRSRGVEDRG